MTEEEKTTRNDQAFSLVALVQTEQQVARHRLVDEMDDCHRGPDRQLNRLMRLHMSIVEDFGIVPLRSTIMP